MLYKYTARHFTRACRDGAALKAIYRLYIDATPQFRATQGSGFAQNDFLHGYTHNEHIVGCKNEHGADMRAKLIVPK